MRWLWHRSLREAGDLQAASRKVPLGIRLLAAGQSLKGLVFLTGAVLTARIARAPDLQDLAMHFVNRFHFDPEGRRVHQVLEWLMGVSHDRLRQVATGLFVYATIFLIEGIGLWFDRPWAEWLVVLGTGLLVPFEIEHLIAAPSWGILAMLIVNLAILGFLARRIRQRGHAKAH